MSNPAPLAGITRSSVIDGRTLLELDDGRVVEVSWVADPSSARAFMATVRRVSAVEIDSNRSVAIAVGKGFRLPFTRPIPVSMALGLLSLGVPGVAR